MSPMSCGHRVLSTCRPLLHQQLLCYVTAAAAEHLFAVCELLRDGQSRQHSQCTAYAPQPCQQQHVQSMPGYTAMQASRAQASGQQTLRQWGFGSHRCLQRPNICSTLCSNNSSCCSVGPWQQVGCNPDMYRMYSSASSTSVPCSNASSCLTAYDVDPIHSINPAALLATRHQRPQFNGRVAAVALSGGVDSAVSALLLKLQGYEVFGVFMHNWDAADEAGAGKPTCTSPADLQDAKAVCASLQIPLYEADFVSKYWNSVFEQFLSGLEQGLTPNPDLACNSHIKFGALLDYATQKGADVLATGHYARLAWSADSQQLFSPSLRAESTAGLTDTTVAHQRVPVLLRGCDPSKDQTYFLAGLHHTQLTRALFPVGHLMKSQVRHLAKTAGLPAVLGSKRSSAGICFIGRRSFGRFLEDFIPPRPGNYVDVDSGKTLGHCHNMLAMTVGQRALGLGGQKNRVYVVGKDLASAVVHVASGNDHPALYSSQALLLNPSWVSGTAPWCPEPESLPVTAISASPRLGRRAENTQQKGVVTSQDSREVHCQFKGRYNEPLAACTVKDACQPFSSSRFCSGFSSNRQAEMASWSAARNTQQQQQLITANLRSPLRGLAPGQMFVMYDGDVCLGSAMIAAHGPTELEARRASLCNDEQLLTR